MPRSQFAMAGLLSAGRMSMMAGAASDMSKIVLPDGDMEIGEKI
jgi:hypothetical protein